MTPWRVFMIPTPIRTLLESLDVLIIKPVLQSKNLQTAEVRVVINCWNVFEYFH